MSEHDSMIERVANAIFEAHRDFLAPEERDEGLLSKTHTKVAAKLYQAMASNAIVVIRQMDAGK